MMPIKLKDDSLRPVVDDSETYDLSVKRKFSEMRKSSDDWEKREYMERVTRAADR